MTNIQYSIVGTDEDRFITVFIPGGDAPLVASTLSHPGTFDAIVEAAKNGDPNVADLFSPEKAVRERFSRLSERVTVANGTVYLDGDPIHSSLTDQVVRFLDEGVEDWKPLVAFFENVLSNPNEHSREQLYNWLGKHRFTITPDGLIVGYKGVRRRSDGTYVSITHGPAVVDGEAVNGAVPNNPGSVVEMARGSVHHDPSVGCSTGLHVGTWSYASGFAQGAVLEVHVNPRDVVSVPTDCNWQKVRACRYTVIQAIDTAYDGACLVGADEDDLDGDDRREFAVADRVTVGEYGLGTIVRVDDADDDLPYYVRFDGAPNPGWYSESDLFHAV